MFLVRLTFARDPVIALCLLLTVRILGIFYACVLLYVRLASLFLLYTCWA
jgi:hypothetical protein